MPISIKRSRKTTGFLIRILADDVVVHVHGESAEPWASFIAILVDCFIRCLPVSRFREPETQITRAQLVAFLP